MILPWMNSLVLLSFLITVIISMLSLYIFPLIPDPPAFSMLLLHTNDVHARFQEVNGDSVRCEDETHLTCYGGFARLKAAVDRFTREAEVRGKPTLYLDAGDAFQGTVFYTEFKWELVAKMVNTLGIHVMCLGNHEFDDRVAGVAPYIGSVSVPIVCSNLNLTEEISLQLPNLTPSIVLDVNGTKVGIIGYLTRDISKRNLGKLKILEEIPSIRAEARNLLAQGINILIALGHSGYEIDKQIAEEVEEIDVVVGGHSHSFLYTGKAPSKNTVRGPYPTVIRQHSGKRVPVVQASYGTKYLGYLELGFDEKGDLISFKGLPKLLSGDLPRDPAVLEVLAPYAEEIRNKYQRTLGITRVLLEGRSAICKFRECTMGNFITDAFLSYAIENYKFEEGRPVVSIGVLHSGAIKANLNPKSDGYSGNIVLEDVMTVLPFECRLVVLPIPGGVLRDALEQAVSRYDRKKDGMFKAHLLQVSGLRVVYDIAQEVNHRLVDVQTWCADCETPAYRPLESNLTYAVIMPKYLAEGGDYFSMFKGLQGLVELDDVDYTVVSKHIQSHSPIESYKLEGRITILNDPIKP